MLMTGIGVGLTLPTSWRPPPPRCRRRRLRRDRPWSTCCARSGSRRGRRAGRHPGLDDEPGRAASRLPARMDDHRRTEPGQCARRRTRARRPVPGASAGSLARSAGASRSPSKRLSPGLPAPAGAYHDRHRSGRVPRFIGSRRTSQSRRSPGNLSNPASRDGSCPQAQPPSCRGWRVCQSVAPIALDRTYRLVTRSDFDGLVCAALLKELGLLEEILFVHPKDVQDGKVELTDRRHHDEPAVPPRGGAGLRPPLLRAASASRTTPTTA